MKIVIKLILVLGLLVALHRNLLFTQQYYAFAGKKNALFEHYKQKADNSKLSNYINYYGMFTGLETGYGFYAPNIPDQVKIEFLIQSATGNKVYNIALNTPEGKERFKTLGNHFNNNPAAQEVVAQSLANYMFRIHPEAQTITMTAYLLHIPAPNEYIQGHYTVSPAMLASYSFNKMRGI